jgi:hypothetical protein
LSKPDEFPLLGRAASSPNIRKMDSRGKMNEPNPSVLECVTCCKRWAYSSPACLPMEADEKAGLFEKSVTFHVLAELYCSSFDQSDK